MCGIYCKHVSNFFTYDHRTLKTRLPVRSALFKQRTGGLVVRWVTTSEYPLLYVFAVFVAMLIFALAVTRDAKKWWGLFGESVSSLLMFWRGGTWYVL
jgi:hypothetical protein